VRGLVAEHPGGACGEARQQAARTQEVDIGERAEEEQAFDAGREAREVEQELALVGSLSMRSSDWIESIQRMQNSALRRIDGMFSTAENACARCSGSGM
jgi:hypothetical protein